MANTIGSSSSSLPRRPYDPMRLFVLPIPSFLSKRLSLGKHKRSLLVHLAGGLFALGWWCFVDAVIMSGKHRRAALGSGDVYEDGVGPYVTFADWSTGLIATLGMLIVNLIDKAHLSSEGYADGSSTTAWRARLVLFCGFALLAGGLAGSITTLVVKYLLAARPPSDEGIAWGVQNVIWNAGIMASAVVLWVAQLGGDEYEYNINL